MNHNKFEKRFAHNNSQTYCTRNKGYIVFDHLNPYFKLQLFKHENNSSQQLALTLFRPQRGKSTTSCHLHPPPFHQGATITTVIPNHQTPASSLLAEACEKIHVMDGLQCWLPMAHVHTKQSNQLPLQELQEHEPSSKYTGS